MAPLEDFIDPIGLTRRQALARGGLAIGALAAGSFALGPKPAAAAARSRGRGFDGPRRDAYIALIGAVGTVAATPVDTSRAGWAADRLAAEYDARLAGEQRAIDDVLDALDRRGITRMSDRGRIAFLRTWADSGRDARALVGHATALAALPFTPEPESEDDVIKPLPVTL